MKKLMILFSLLSASCCILNKSGANCDKDNDGIANRIDNCPDVAGFANLNGCPDTTSLSLSTPSADPNDTTKDWTFLIYMNADNNLEQFSLIDFYEMAKVGSTQKVNIIVQLDRAEGYSTEYGDWKQTLRFKVEKNMQPIVSNATMDLGEVNMCDSTALSDFIQWGHQNYPAKRYALVIWSHGAGWRSIPEIDSTNSSPAIASNSNYLDRIQRVMISKSKNNSVAKALITKTNEQVLTEYKNLKKLDSTIGMTRAPLLSSVKAIVADFSSNDILYNRKIQNVLLKLKSNNNYKVDLVGFDACLMGMIETGYAMRNACEVMVASEEVVPGNGMDYNRVFSALVNNSNLSSNEMGVLIVDKFREAYSSAGEGTTMSSVNLSKMDLVANEISSLSDSMISNFQTEKDNIHGARISCLEYSSTNSIDLINFLTSYRSKTTNQNIKSKINNLIILLNLSITNRYCDELRCESGANPQYGSNGLAIFFPKSKFEFNRENDSDAYLESNNNHPVEFVQNHRWDNFIAKYINEYLY